MSIATITLNPCIDKTCRVERVVPEHKLRTEDVRRYPGGGGINVARVIRRLGGDVRALWSCGGSTGELLSELLDAESVSHDPVRIEDHTRENLIVRDDSSNEQYRFVMPGPVLTQEERTRWMQSVSQCSARRLVVFSGSLPPGASLDWFAKLIKSVPAKARILVDTKKKALTKAMEAGVYLVKPNIRELEDIAGRELENDAQIIETAREIIERNPVEVLLISLGRGGAILVTPNETERLHAPTVKIRSKVGAGDSMVGGLAFALDQGRPLADAARLAMAAGAAAVMTEGTDLCHRQDVERLYECIREDNPSNCV